MHVSLPRLLKISADIQNTTLTAKSLSADTKDRPPAIDKGIFSFNFGKLSYKDVSVRIATTKGFIA